MLSLLNWLQIRSTSNLENPASLSIAAHAEDATVEHCDVLVVGGTPSGVAAALAAARRGMKVVLIEERPHLGGDIYYAMLNMFDVPMKPGQASPVVYGIFAEFFEQLGMSFSVDKARRLLEEAVAAEPNIHTYRHTRVVRVISENDQIKGIVTCQIPLPTPPAKAPTKVVLIAGKKAPDKKVVGKKVVDKKVTFGKISAAKSSAILKPAVASRPMPSPRATATPEVTATPAAQPALVERTIVPKVVIDATNDADVAARAGAGYYRGRENANPDKRMQSAGLLFSVSGVDWNEVRAYARRRRPVDLSRIKDRTAIDIEIARSRPGKIVVAPQDISSDVRSTPSAKASFDLKPVTTLNPSRLTSVAARPTAWVRLGGYYGDYVWERGDIIKNYKPHGSNIITLSINFGRQSDGTVVLNTINIINVNGLSSTSLQRAHAEAAREVPYFLSYLRQRMPGFKKARIAKIAPELYIRETRHIHGFYTLKVEDIVRQTKFDDRVALVSYPLDLHPYTKNEHNAFGPRRYYYTLPLRALVPRGVNNVFVASRSLSATYSAAGSARVIPITMAAGEAAGTAAWLCVTHGTTPHDMVTHEKQIKQLREALLEWGVDVGDHCPRPAL